jgi:PKD repeat protein
MGPTVNGNIITNSQTLYMVYNQLNTGLWIMKSEYTDLGIAWKPGNRGRAVTKDVAARDLMAIDQHDGTIYLANTGAAGLYIYVSTDGATSFTRVKVMDGAVDSFENIFVVDAVDDAGNVYLAWTDQHNVTLAASQDKGQSWRFMNLVSGNGTRVLPWVTAGDAGRVGVVWYETNETGSSDNLNNASWAVMAAVTADAFADNVTFYESVVDPFVHYGTIRTTGATGSADRDLGDFMSCDVDSMGRLVMTFGNDGNDGSNMYKSTVMYAHQTGGPFLRENAGPVARFTKELDGLKITVNGRDSYDKNGKGISSYQWRWGDGTNTTGQDPTATHTYKHGGHYNLTLVVTNRDNMTGSDMVRLNVIAPAPPSAVGWYAGIGVAVAVAAGVYVWQRRRRVKMTKPVL